MNKEQLNEKLKQAINFTKDDLHMNKQGMLTPSQAQMLKNNDNYNGSKTGKLIIGITIGGFFLGLAKEGAKFFNPALILSFLGLSALMYFGYSFYNKNNLKKLEEGRVKVEKLEGKLNSFFDAKMANSTNAMGQYTGVIKTATNFAGVNYADYANMLEINGKKISTTKEISEAFEKDKEYAIYFIRSTKTEYQNTIHGAVIVSAEAI